MLGLQSLSLIFQIISWESQVRCRQLLAMGFCSTLPLCSPPGGCKWLLTTARFHSPPLLSCFYLTTAWWSQPSCGGKTVLGSPSDVSPGKEILNNELTSNIQPSAMLFTYRVVLLITQQSCEGYVLAQFTGCFLSVQRCFKVHNGVACKTRCCSWQHRYGA